MNKDTDENTKDHLREKIEAQELFVPKDERKITNLVQKSQEHAGMIADLRNENSKLRTQLEEILERGQAAKAAAKAAATADPDDS